MFTIIGAICANRFLSFVPKEILSQREDNSFSYLRCFFYSKFQEEKYMLAKDGFAISQDKYRSLVKVKVGSYGQLSQITKLDRKRLQQFGSGVTPQAYEVRLILRALEVELKDLLPESG